jgi:hypothetical protein
VPSTINRVPPGLLSLLGIQSTGINPSVLLDSVQPVFDLEQLYLQASSISEGTSISLTSQGVFQFNIGAGPGEVLVVNGCAMYATGALGAGTTIAFTPIVISTTATPFAVTIVGPNVRQTTGNSIVSGTDQTFFVPPNHNLGLYCTEWAGIAPTVNCFARTLRLRV